MSCENSYGPMTFNKLHLRLLVLYKFGGVYLDTDIISLKRLPHEYVNFLMLQQENSVSNGIMGFERNHPFLNCTINYLVANFAPYKWGSQVFKHTTYCVWTELQVLLGTKSCHCMHLRVLQHFKRRATRRFKMHFK